jgi:GAF domain-containing protein
MEQAGGDLPETLKLLNIKSVMCVPLISGSKLWGVLYADSVTKPYGFRGEDLHLLSALSSPVAMAIENALFTPKKTAS